ncbi:MAG: glycoside hydrolase family 32 protein [Clostridia bacterium]|nr:glycoside hydrolase family 32 protein [Clostridia bacterium]
MKEKTIVVRSAFLALPVSNSAGNTRVCFYKKDGTLADDITLRLDYENPDAVSYYPIGKWMGGEITVRTGSDTEPRDMQTDEPVNARRGEEYRPLLHFTPEYGWNNDPNGLVKFTSQVTGETVWHLFYQFNPYDWIWGNMHWGHAVSPDLLHWTPLPIALYPDEGGTMFSGSAVVDTENRTGLKTGEEDVILLYYTSAGDNSLLSAGKPFTQCLAYSTDGGKTFEKYAKNPVVGHILDANRDPKVIWCEELGKFVMALYLTGNLYCLLTSENLLDWTELQRIPIEGDGECPDFYPLCAGGDPAKCMWVLSGASHNYLVGSFEDGKFVPAQKVRRLSFGSSSYAAQTYSTPDEYERIQLAWDRDMRFGDGTFMGQIGIPCRLSLAEDADGYVLCAAPVDGLESLVKDEKRFADPILAPGEDLTVPLADSAFEIEMEFDPRNVPGKLKAELFGNTLSVDPAEKTVRLGDCVMPLGTPGPSRGITVVADRGSAEIFAFGGGAIMTVPWNYEKSSLKAVFSFEGEGKASLRRISVKKLEL